MAVDLFLRTMRHHLSRIPLHRSIGIAKTTHLLRCRDTDSDLSTSLIEDRFFEEIVGIVDGANAMDNCTKCIMSTELMHLAAITQPVQTITNLLVRAWVNAEF